MNIFPSGAFQTNLLAAPWFEIPTAAVASERKKGSSGSSARASSGAVDTPQGYYLRQVGMLAEGCGVILTDLCRAWVGYLSPTALKNQLERKMPGVSIELIEALRLIERCVAECKFNYPTASTGAIVQLGTAPTRKLTVEMLPDGTGTLLCEAPLDLELDERRAVPLTISLDINLFEVSTLVDSSQKLTATALFMRDAVFVPFMQSMGDALALGDSFRREVHRYNPRSPSVAGPLVEVAKPLVQPLLVPAANLTLTQHHIAKAASDARLVVSAASSAVAGATEGETAGVRGSTKQTGKGAAATTTTGRESQGDTGTGNAGKKTTAAATKTSAVTAKPGTVRESRKAGRRDDDIVVQPDTKPSPKLGARTSSYIETAEEAAAKKRLQEQLEIQSAVAAQTKKKGGAVAVAPTTTSETAKKEEKMKKIRKVLL